MKLSKKPRIPTITRCWVNGKNDQQIDLIQDGRPVPLFQSTVRVINQECDNIASFEVRVFQVEKTTKFDIWCSVSVSSGKIFIELTAMLFQRKIIIRNYPV